MKTTADNKWRAPQCLPAEAGRGRWVECVTVVATVMFSLALLFPAATTARSSGKSALCLSNLHILSQAWLAYPDDNDGRLIGGSNYYTRTPYRWVEVPLYKPTDNPEKVAVPSYSDIKQEYFLNGIKAGKLYPYVNNTAVYHCPSDRNYVTYPNTEYRTYNISGLMNGEDFTGRNGLYGPITSYRSVYLPSGQAIQLICAERYSQIKNPSTKYVFVEENVYQHGQWMAAGGFVIMSGGNYWSWWDWPADFHGGLSDSFGFADGHAQTRRWMDRRTIQIIQYGNAGQIGGISENQPDNHDLDWMNKGYIVAE